MNRPDFENKAAGIMVVRKDGEEVTEEDYYAAGCHHVWDNYVTSLQSQLRDSALLYQNVVNSNSEKDKEIERLKEVSPDHMKNAYKENAEMWRDEYNNKCKELRHERIIIDELREALREVLDYAVATGHGITEELEARCRKLIGE